MIRSATAFLPDSMITFMNFERSTEPNFGSGRISRLGTSRRRGMGVFLPSFQLVQALGPHLEGPIDPSLTRQARKPACPRASRARRPASFLPQAFLGLLAPYFER